VSDPIDETLKELARAEASRGFAARVRARIDAGEQARVAWPRVAVACVAMVLVAALGWWIQEEPRPAQPVAQSAAPAAAAGPPVAAPRLEPRSRPLDTSAITRASHPVARAIATPPAAADHDRALPSLTPLEALSVSPIAPDALVLGEQVVTPLAPIAPISTVRDEVADAERGKL
jgi:hypothetical protein